MSVFRSLPVVLVAVFLAGCISVFPKQKPIQLYRFGAVAATSQATPRTGAPFTVQPLAMAFAHAAAGDRILTVTGDEAAYIRDARWVSSASTLFASAIADTFTADSGPARILTPGQAVSADYFLTVDVRTFEASYVHGQGAPPTIIVRVAASLSRPENRTLVAEQLFSASVPADANRGEAIAAAFNQAVSQTVVELVGWVDAAGPPPRNSA